MIQRKYSAYQVTRPDNSWGGTYGDSKTWAGLFRSYDQPKNLGVIDIEVFSKQVNGKLLNKPMTFRAGQNMIELDAQAHGKVRWSLALAGIPRARIVDVDPNLGSYPGQGNTRFKIALNRGDYHEPILLKTEKTLAPRLRIIGYPFSEAPDKHWYEVEIQDGDPSAYMPVEELAVGKTVKDDSTSVSDEMNQKYAGIEFGSTSDYAAQISYFGRKFEVTDRFIRLELDARKKGQGSPGTSAATYGGMVPLTSVVTQQYATGPKGMTKDNILQKGLFLTNMERMLRDRLMMDRENDMYFGRTQTSYDEDSNYQRLNGSGWFQAAQEGNYDEHDRVNLTLQDIVGKIQALKFNVDDPNGNVVELESGTGGFMLWNHLIGLEVGALPFTLSSSYFIDEATSNFTQDGLALRYQFVEYSQLGRIYRLVWNPNKDNLDCFPEVDPETGIPLESYSYDVFDLGKTPDAMGNKNNIGLVHEPGAYEWFTVSNVYDFARGSIKDGSNAYDDRKEAYVRMAINGSAVFFDVSRTLRLASV